MRWLVIVALSGCSFSSPFGDGGSGDGDGDPDKTPEDIDYVTATGTIVDFLTGEPISGGAVESVDLTGGMIELDGAAFEVSRILPHSVFRLRVSSPDHETTISALIAVQEQDVSGITVEVVASDLIADAYAAAGIERTDGVLVSRLFDTETAAPVAGVRRDAFAVGEAVVFLDGENNVSMEAPASTSSGIALVLNVAPGLVELASAVAEHTFTAPGTRVESDVVSIVDVEVGADPPEIPTGLLFEEDIMPIFAARGCNNCHQGNGPGRQQGGFSLQGNPSMRHQAVLVRVDLETPEDSLVLHKPSFEDPWDGHQIVFANKADPDYLTMLGWIIEGAPYD